MTLRKRHTPQLKVKVAVEALKGRVTVAEIASGNGIAPAQVSTWKKEAMRILEDGFTGSKASRKSAPDGFAKEELLMQIGQLKVENDWLKKKL
jgi:transposase-like protein